MAAVGDIYEAPWGRYIVHRVTDTQITLRSLERVAAFVIYKVLPDADYTATGEVVGSDTVPRRADPENGLNRGGAGRPVRLEATIGEGSERPGVEVTAVSPVAAPSCGVSGKPLDAAEVVFVEPHDRIGKAIEAIRRISIALPDPPTLGGVRPGCARGGWGPSWIPCLTRAKNDNDQPSSLEHCWFLADTDGSLYCEVCRRGKPLVVVGDTAAIAAVKSALERGDRARVTELVHVRMGGGGATVSSPPPSSSPVPAILSGGPFPPEIASPLSELASSGAPAEAMVLPSGSLGHGGGPPVVDPTSVHPARAGTDEAKASLPQVDAPPPPREHVSVKDDTADFSRPVRTFKPRDLDDWKEYAAERAAIRQYECAATLEEARMPGRKEEAERFARELAGPPPRSRAA